MPPSACAGERLLRRFSAKIPLTGNVIPQPWVILLASDPRFVRPPILEYLQLIVVGASCRHERASPSAASDPCAGQVSVPCFTGAVSAIDKLGRVISTATHRRQVCPS